MIHSVGTQILLSLNDINIDYGKNRYWKSHFWLFPPGSEANVPTEYVSGVQLQPGYAGSLVDVRFRLCHLGYSYAETRAKFETYVHRWQRTDDDVQITYDGFHDTMTGIEFTTLTSSDLKPDTWDFRDFVIDRLATTQRDKHVLEDFIYGLDPRPHRQRMGHAQGPQGPQGPQGHRPADLHQQPHSAVRTDSGSPQH